jgi:hypothetical protein
MPTKELLESIQAEITRLEGYESWRAVVPLLQQSADDRSG